MKKAYLNILMDARSEQMIVVEVQICSIPGHRMSYKELCQFWATVVECEGETFSLASGKIVERLKAGAEKIPAMKALNDLLCEDSEDPEEDTWDPEPDALGG